MQIPEQYRLKNTIKYPTSIIIGGLSKLGFEIADSLIEQGGYVILVDAFTRENIEKLKVFPKDTLISFLDFTSIPHLEEEIRRLDYVFYFAHEGEDFEEKISTQSFLTFSNYIDTTLSLASKFDAKFLLTTAIKAHQLEISSHELSVEYGVNAQKHKTYTKMEIQKYAESLTMEYNENTDLDTRIVRLPEIIGDGIDFGSKTVFTNLILDAINSKPLKLKKDGLEQEWYAHLLDVAYGLIKAQFSQNTNGKIFSISYEQPITHLSLAYKIQELEENSREIQFVSEKDNLPSLRLYKPAPNLTQIGWAPRVPFEKAVSQSIAAAKIYLVEKSQDRSHQLTGSAVSKESGVFAKLKKFLALADTDTRKTQAEMGPVSRLIAERRKEEDIKNKRIEIAGNAIKSKRKRRPRTLAEKYRAWLWNNVISLGNLFSFFKYRSPVEIAFLTVIAVVFIFLYLTIVSPFIVLTRNSFQIYSEYRNIKTEVSENNWANIENRSERIKNNLKDSASIIKRFESIAGLITLDDEVNDIIYLLDSYALYASGMEDIGYALGPFIEYTNLFENNTQIRSGSDTFLSANDSAKGYENLLLEFEDRQPYIQLGKDKISKSVSQLNNFDYSFIPGSLFESIIDLNIKLNDNQKSLEKVEAAGFIPEILGANNSHTYLILILDNTRQSPIGGDISAFALITFDKGVVSEIVVQSIDEISFDLSPVSDLVVKEINSKKFNLETLDTIEIRDVVNISDFSYFSFVASSIWEKTYNREIDGVVTMNFNVLEDLISYLSESNEILIDGVRFDKDNFLTSLNSAQVGNQTLKTKNRIVAQVTSVVINNSLNNLEIYFNNILSILADNAKQQNIMAHSSTLDYGSYLEKNNFDGSSVFEADSFVTASVNNLNYKIINQERYPSNDIDLDILISNDLKIDYQMTINFANLGSVQEVAVCFPLTVQTDIIKTSNFPKERTLVTTGAKEKCLVAQSFTEDSLKLSWTVSNNFIETNEETFLINLAIGKIKGAVTSMDVEVNIDRAFKVLSVEPFINEGNGRLLFVEDEVESDQIIELKLTK